MSDEKTFVMNMIYKVVIRLPETVARRLRDLGVDVEAKLIDVLIHELNMDPTDEVRARAELAEKYLEEGEKLVDKDTVQACEKLYKVAEEAIKALAVAEKLEEANKAKERGRWTLSLLDAAARKLSEKINERIYDDWDHAYFLHVEGFHEARLKPEQVRARLKYVKELLGILKERAHMEAKQQA
ncbi:MAG: PaREP1 family protein [Candidatus Baldrarchaeia archaeon]